GVARQAVDKHDAARVLVARQSSLEELENGRFMQIFFLADDAGARGLAPFRVVDADHRRLGDGRAIGEDVLELGGVDVLAARDDYVPGAADDPVETALVQARQVAGPEPALRGKTG